MRVGCTADGNVVVATSSSDFGSSPTNGEFIRGESFALPMVAGAPLRAAGDEDSKEYWSSLGIFFAGPQGPDEDGTWPGWVIDSIAEDDLDAQPQLDEFDAAQRLTRCWHGVEHVANGCSCSDRCCENAVPELDTQAADGWYSFATRSGALYLIRDGGARVERRGRDGRDTVWHRARFRPPVLRAGESTRFDTSDDWMRPTMLRGIRRLANADLASLGVSAGA